VRMRGLSSATTLLFKESLHFTSVVLADLVAVLQIPLGIVYVCDSKISRTRLPQMAYRASVLNGFTVYDVHSIIEGIVFVAPAEEPLVHTARIVPAFFGDNPHPADRPVCGFQRNYFMRVGSL